MSGVGNRGQSQLLFKCFGHLVPVGPSETCTWDADVNLLGKARKRERKLRASLALKCNDPKAFKYAATTYLSSSRVLMACMLEANQSRPLRQRISLRKIIEASESAKVLEKLDEVVQVHCIPKSNGLGLRPICNFGPVARGAQRMVLKLLRAATKPAPFQFTRLGVHKALLRKCDEGFTL